MKHIVGLIEPDEGDVLINGESVVRASAQDLARIRAQIGYAFQDGALLDSLTVRENLTLALDAESRTQPQTDEDRITSALRLVNLGPHVLDKYPRELSGGMRKRVGVARAVVNKPKFILYDEPTTGLDPANVAAIADVIRRTHEELDATCIMVTHDMALLERIATRVILLGRGKIRYDGSPLEFLRVPSHAVAQFLGKHL